VVESREFQDKQYAFAAHIRDPENTLAPAGIEDRRMAIYRDLFFNNLLNLLGTFFPVLKTIHCEQHWRHLIREFMKIHRAKTPYFLQLPEEFLAFLQDGYQTRDDDYPFLNELAHYEYVELALRVSDKENDLSGISTDGDLLTGSPVKSVLAWAFAYHYPVHRISKDFLPGEPDAQPTYLVVYRRSDDEVRFLQLNAVTAGLLDAVDNNKDCVSGDALLRQLAAASHYPDVEALVQHGADALKEMLQLDILTGTRPAAG
jgi:hypothetical protein